LLTACSRRNDTGWHRTTSDDTGRHLEQGSLPGCSNLRIRCPKGRGSSTLPSRTPSDLRIFARWPATRFPETPTCSRLITGRYRRAARLSPRSVSEIQRSLAQKRPVRGQTYPGQDGHQSSHLSGGKAAVRPGAIGADDPRRSPGDEDESLDWKRGLPLGNAEGTAKLRGTSLRTEIRPPRHVPSKATPTSC